MLSAPHGKMDNVLRFPLGAGITEFGVRNIVFHAARAAPFGRQAYHLPPERGTQIGVNLLTRKKPLLGAAISGQSRCLHTV